MKMKIKELGGGNPIPEGIYKMRVTDISPKVFGTGSEGYTGSLAVIDNDDYNNRLVFENFVVYDAEGGLSGAAFRWAQFITACYGDDIEIDMEDRTEVDTITEGAIDREILVQISVAPEDKEKGYKAKNDVVKFQMIE